MKVLIRNIEEAAFFCDVLNTYDQSFDLDTGRNVVDAKSFLGVVATAIGKPSDLSIVTPITTKQKESLEWDLRTFISRGSSYV